MNISEFITAQLDEWPEARQRFDALAGCLTRTLDTPVRPITVQHNPARAVSTGAAVDKGAIARRPCFLCRANRPTEQRALPFGDYEILVNPYPIFPEHLTIACTAHTPQRIAGRFADMLRLTDALPGHTIFYNGPRCGASAPDHLHFQAAPTRCFPIIGALREATPAAAEGRISLYDLLPACFAIDDPTPEILSGLPDRLPADVETGLPMVNILAWHDEEGRHAIVIPRRRHRPACYGNGAGCRLISPASVDLAGVFVAPRAEDFRNITADETAGIISEVTYPVSQLANIITH